MFSAEGCVQEWKAGVSGAVWFLLHPLKVWSTLWDRDRDKTVVAHAHGGIAYSLRRTA